MINIFIDTSGSMSEMGKDSGAIYVVKSIQDYSEFHNIKTDLYKFNGDTVSDVTSIKFNENIDNKLLKEFINSKNIMGNILISDGLFNEEKLDNMVSIAIGIDADIFNLEKVTSKVFKPENIIEAVEYLLFINENNNTQEEEDEDDEW